MRDAQEMFDGQRGKCLMSKIEGNERWKRLMGKLSYKLKRGGLIGSRITAEARGADAKAAATRDTTSVCLGGLSGLGDIECGRA